MSPGRRARRSLALLLASGLVWVATPAPVAAAAGDPATVVGAAVGHSASIDRAGSTLESGPFPSVVLAPSGGFAADTAPAVTVQRDDPRAPEASFLRTGSLSVDTSGDPAAESSVTSASAVADVDALDGTLRAASVSSTCSAARADRSASSALADATVMVAGQALALPSSPPPGTVVEATDVATGDAITVYLNEHATDAASVTVTAARIVLHGPGATGEIVLARSRCGHTGGSTDDDNASGDGSTDSPDAPQRVDVAPMPTAPEPQPVGFAAADVTKVAGGAFGFYTKVGLFGGPQNAKGPKPTVELPPGGADPAVTVTSTKENVAQYGPAVIFEAGRITVSTKGKLGDGGSVTSSADVFAKDDEGWDPFHYKEVHSTCTATDKGATGSVDIEGFLVTKIDPETQEPAKSEPIPKNIPVNYERTGTLDHVGDRWRMVLNEQIKHPDGSITVNGAHMFLLGDIAVGEMIVGQVRCGVTAAQVTTTTTSAPTSTSTGVSTTTGGGTTSTPGSAASSSSGAGGSASAGGTASGGSAASAGGTGTGGAAVLAGSSARRGAGSGATGSSGAPLARTGADAHLAEALALVIAAFVARRVARRPEDEAGAPSHGRT